MEIKEIVKNIYAKYKYLQNRNKITVQKIKSMSREQFIENYSKVKAEYNFLQNKLKYLMSTLIISIISTLGYATYMISKKYLANYNLYIGEQQELLTISVAIIVGILAILIVSFIVILYISLRTIKSKEEELYLYENVYENYKEDFKWLVNL